MARCWKNLNTGRTIRFQLGRTVSLHISSLGKPAIADFRGEAKGKRQQFFRRIWMFLWCKICLGSRWGVKRFCQAISLDMILLLDFNKISTRIGCRSQLRTSQNLDHLGYILCLPYYPEASAEETCCFNDALKSLCLAGAAAIRSRGTKLSKQKYLQLGSWSRNWWLKSGETAEGSNAQSVIVILWFETLLLNISRLIDRLECQQ